MNLESYNASLRGCVWRDFSHFGCFICRGTDAGALLHQLTTNDIKGMATGEVRDAALVTVKGRLLDVVTVLRRASDWLVITSPNRRELFPAHARKFVLFRQDVSIEDITGSEALLAVFGAGVASNAVPELAGLGAAAAGQLELAGIDCQAWRTTRLPGGGVLLRGDGGALRGWLARRGWPGADDDTYNVLRVEAGVPVAGRELTEDANPWEAGLAEYVSLHKGCYNGQEVIARLNSYDKVKQHLMGVLLGRMPATSAPLPLFAEGKSAGTLTSNVLSPRLGPVGLAYVRNAWMQPGQRLEVREPSERIDADVSASMQSMDATVIHLPFVLRDEADRTEPS